MSKEQYRIGDNLGHMHSAIAELSELATALIEANPIEIDIEFAVATTVGTLNVDISFHGDVPLPSPNNRARYRLNYNSVDYEFNRSDITVDTTSDIWIVPASAVSPAITTAQAQDNSATLHRIA